MEIENDGIDYLLTNLPRFLEYLPDETALFIRTMQVDVPKLVTKTTEDLKAGVDYPRPIFVKALLESNLSKEDKAPDRMYAEVLGLLGAGTETTAWWVLVQMLMLSDRLLILCSLFFPKSLDIRDRAIHHHIRCLCSTRKMAGIY